MNPVRSIIHYLKHILNSKRWDSFHSPYLYSLFSFCCDEDVSSNYFERIELERKKLKQSDEVISRTDHGAGSLNLQKKRFQKISQIARYALSLPFQCRFLYRLTLLNKSKTILEFGTSLGISTAYLACANPSGNVITIEGDAELGARAKKIWIDLGLKNIQLHTTAFETYIQHLEATSLDIDLFFLDGNHQSQALLTYYHALLHCFNSNTILVIDDIHWSADMYEGWEQLIALPEITQSVDCYFFGLLFFRSDFLNKQHHTIRLPWGVLR